MRRVRRLCTTVTVTALLLSISPVPGSSRVETTSPAGWSSRVSQYVARAEYHFSATPDGAWVAPNRAQGVRLRADATGMQVSPRKGDTGAWDLGLKLRSFGRDGAMMPVGPAVVSATEERVEQRRAALGLTEWYVNAGSGVEQGFTIDAAPVGESPLVLEIACTGSLEAREDRKKDTVRFDTQDGEPALTYSGLMAQDASGAPVETALAIIPGGLRITVEDQGHPYPIVVDPTILVTPAWSYFGDQFDERLGASVAGAGDVNGDGFADILVGAYQYDNGGVFDEGRVFLFLGSSAGPSLIPAWTYESNQTGAWLGFSVASAGDVNGDGYGDVVIGAPQYDLGAALDEGRAFVFLGSSIGLGATPVWTADSAQSGARLGSSVASAGDVDNDGIGDLIVGAPGFDNGQNSDEGRAFVYLGSLAGPATQPVWFAGSGLFSSAFGTSVASAGDVNGDGFDDVIVGSPLFDAGGFFDEGRTFVYLGSVLGPSLNPSWVADGNKNLAKFGQSVAGAGDVNGDGFSDVIIGAPADGSGRVVIYQGSAAGLGLTAAFSAKINKSPAEFGASVAGVGDVNGDGFADIAIGAPRIGDQGAANEGLVRVYYGGRNGVASSAALAATKNQPNAFLGGCVAGAGDVNGDGVSDVLAGAVGLDNGPLAVANSGGAELYLGFRPTKRGQSGGSLHGIRFPD
jgi:hypothetical protein